MALRFRGWREGKRGKIAAWRPPPGFGGTQAAARGARHDRDEAVSELMLGRGVVFACAGLNRPMLKVESREFAHLSGNWVVELIRQMLHHEAPGFRDWSDDACPGPAWPDWLVDAVNSNLQIFRECRCVNAHL